MVTAFMNSGNMIIFVMKKPIKIGYNHLYFFFFPPPSFPNLPYFLRPIEMTQMKIEKKKMKIYCNKTQYNSGQIHFNLL